MGWSINDLKNKIMKLNISITLIFLACGFIACDSTVQNKTEATKAEETNIEVTKAKEISEPPVPEIISSESLEEIWQKLPLKSLPLIEATNFDNIKATKELNAEQIKTFQLGKIYSGIGQEGLSYRFLPSYRLELSEEFFTIVLNVFKGEHELETLLINYDLKNNWVAHQIMAYDEIAEGWARKHADLDNNIITIVSTIYGEDEQLDTAKYHINRFGEINQVKTKFSSDIRPGEAIQLKRIYSDTITFSHYNDDADYMLLTGKKNGKDVALIYNWDWRNTEQYHFKDGDKIVIKWKMAEISIAGDGETLDHHEWAIDAERLVFAGEIKD